MKKLAYLGPTHTFSDLCYKTHYKDAYSPLHCNTIEEAFDSIDGSTDALVPIENSTDGFVQKTLDLLIQKDLFIMEEQTIPIKFAFFGHLKYAERIYVQFKSFGQCKKFIKDHPNLEVVLTSSNQKSYDLYKNKSDSSIIPLHLISNEKHISNIEDYENNQTRFILISKKLNNIGKSASLVISPKIDRPGLLYDILGIFKKYDINLTSIISRPTKKVLGTYHFFIETKFINFNPNKFSMLLDIIRESFNVKLLGIY